MENLFAQFIQEITTKSAELATKSSELVVAASKHTGVFVSFYDIGNTVVKVFGSLFK